MRVVRTKDLIGSIHANDDLDLLDGPAAHQHPSSDQNVLGVETADWDEDTIILGIDDSPLELEG